MISIIKTDTDFIYKEAPKPIVDAPIFVPDEVICGLQCNAKSIMVNEGEYKFVQEEQYVTINKRKFVSYGYVIVDITMR